MPGIAGHDRHLCMEGNLDEREITGIRDRAGNRQGGNKHAFPLDECQDLIHALDRKCEFFPVQDSIVLVKDSSIEDNGDVSVDDKVEYRGGRPMR